MLIYDFILKFLLAGFCCVTTWIALWTYWVPMPYVNFYEWDILSIKEPTS